MNLLLLLSFETTSVIKRFLCLLTKPSSVAFPSYTKTGNRQQSSLWQASSQAVILIDYWKIDCCAESDLGRKIKITILTEATSVVLFIDCFEVQLMLAEPSGCIEPIYSGIKNGITSSHEVFRCELLLNSNAWVRTLSSLKYAYHVCFDPTWNTTPSPAWMWEIWQATVSCIMYFINLHNSAFFVCLRGVKWMNHSKWSFPVSE